MASALLTRLRQGPLRTDDFAEVSVSRRALRANIHRLRERGVQIESVDVPGSAVRRAKVEYRLLGEA